MRVRTTQKGFVSMLHIKPLMPADIEYSLKEFSCQPYYCLKFSFVFSYKGKYMV